MTTIPPLPRYRPVEVLPCDPEPRPDTHLACLRTAQGQLPLAAVDISADIIGLFANVRVTQRFHNPRSSAIEAVYVFPLPDRASVHSCTAQFGDRRVEATLEERGQAREDYFEALERGQRATLLEEDRPEVFTMSVGNIDVGEDTTITIDLSMPLAVEGDEVTFRFPLVVAPRYVSGASIDGGRAGDGTADDTDAAPDASRVTPPPLLDPAAGPEASIRVRIDDSGLGAHHIVSTLHAARVAHDDGYTLLDLAPNTDDRGRLLLDRDVVIRYRIDGGPHLWTHACAVGEADGVVTVSLTATGDAPVRPRDVMLLLDRSGSMGGWKMVAARRAAARIVDSLNCTDRVWAAGFDTTVDTSPSTPNLVDATDRVRYRTVEFLARLEARGGTELVQAIAQAALVSNAVHDPGANLDAERDRILVLVTDGLFAAEDHAVRTLADELRGVQVVAVGIDEAVNGGLLRRLAGKTGLCELVESEDRLDVALDRIVRRVAPPVLTRLRLEAAPSALLQADTVAPFGATDVADGACTTLAARFLGERPEHLTITGTKRDGSKYSDTLSVHPTSNPAPRHAWARARLRDLEDDARLGRTPQEHIVELSLAEHVLCRYTAFVAVDSESAKVIGPVTTVMQPSRYTIPPTAVRGLVRVEAAATLGKSIRVGQDIVGVEMETRSVRSSRTRSMGAPKDQLAAPRASVTIAPVIASLEAATDDVAVPRCAQE